MALQDSSIWTHLAHDCAALLDRGRRTGLNVYQGPQQRRVSQGCLHPKCLAVPLHLQAAMRPQRRLCLTENR